MALPRSPDSAREVALRAFCSAAATGSSLGGRFWGCSCLVFLGSSFFSCFLASSLGGSFFLGGSCFFSATGVAAGLGSGFGAGFGSGLSSGFLTGAASLGDAGTGAGWRASSRAGAAISFLGAGGVGALGPSAGSPMCPRMGEGVRLPPGAPSTRLIITGGVSSRTGGWLGQNQISRKAARCRHKERT